MGSSTAGRLARRLAIALESLWDSDRVRRRDRDPADLRLVPYLGHGGPEGVVVRARVLHGAVPSDAVEGEHAWHAVRRTVARFLTDEVAGVEVRVRVGDDEVVTTSDHEGYVDVRLAGVGAGAGPWLEGVVELPAGVLGRQEALREPVQVRVPGPSADLALVSDVDDTVLETGAQDLVTMLRQTFTGSALTRAAVPGAAELYRALVAGADGRGDRPVFYVSSSPWNLHGFLVAFLRRRRLPVGPLLLRDLLGDDPGRHHATTKTAAVEEVLGLHPRLRVVLLGDTGQDDPRIYADVVARHADRVAAVYLREVRLDPADGRTEAALEGWPADVPVLVTDDLGSTARHAADLGLLDPARVAGVETAAAG